MNIIQLFLDTYFIWNKLPNYIPSFIELIYACQMSMPLIQRQSEWQPPAEVRHDQQGHIYLTFLTHLLLIMQTCQPSLLLAEFLHISGLLPPPWAGLMKCHFCSLLSNNVLWIHWSSTASTIPGMWPPDTDSSQFSLPYISNVCHWLKGKQVVQWPAT